jgi:hypothetical protein
VHHRPRATKRCDGGNEGNEREGEERHRQVLGGTCIPPFTLRARRTARLAARRLVERFVQRPTPGAAEQKRLEQLTQREADRDGTLAVVFAYENGLVANIRGVDASWFPAAAIASNALWILGTLALAFALFRMRGIPRLVAVGLVVANNGAIPLAMVGGGIVTGCYWLALGYLLTFDALERHRLEPSTL